MEKSYPATGKLAEANLCAMPTEPRVLREGAFRYSVATIPALSNTVAAPRAADSRQNLHGSIPLFCNISRTLDAGWSKLGLVALTKRP